jgi:hypothetical protein
MPFLRFDWTNLRYIIYTSGRHGCSMLLWRILVVNAWHCTVFVGAFRWLWSNLYQSGKSLLPVDWFDGRNEMVWGGMMPRRMTNFVFVYITSNAVRYRDKFLVTRSCQSHVLELTWFYISVRECKTAHCWCIFGFSSAGDHINVMHWPSNNPFA